MQCGLTGGAGDGNRIDLIKRGELEKRRNAESAGPCQRNNPISGRNLCLRHCGSRRSPLGEPAVDADPGWTHDADVDVQSLHLMDRPVSLLSPRNRRNGAADVVDLKATGSRQYDGSIQ